MKIYELVTPQQKQSMSQGADLLKAMHAGIKGDTAQASSDDDQDQIISKPSIDSSLLKQILGNIINHRPLDKEQTASLQTAIANKPKTPLYNVLLSVISGKSMSINEIGLIKKYYSQI